MPDNPEEEFICLRLCITVRLAHSRSLGVGPWVVPWVVLRVVLRAALRLLSAGFEALEASDWQPRLAAWDVAVAAVPGIARVQECTCSVRADAPPRAPLLRLQSDSPARICSRVPMRTRRNTLGSAVVIDENRHVNPRQRLDDSGLVVAEALEKLLVNLFDSANLEARNPRFV